MLERVKRGVSRNLARSRAKRSVRRGLFDDVDVESVAKIAAQFDDHMYQKYYKRLHHSFVRNAERIHALGLSKTTGLRILDVGSGFGFFMHAAKKFGHEAIGLDQDDPFFNAIAPVMGVDRVVHRIEVGEPLPEIPGGPFDLITAFATCFDGAGTEEQWGVPEWEYFLEDLARRMAPGCRLYVKFNQYVGGGARPGPDCQPIPDDLMAHFSSLGATFTKRAMDLRDAPAALGAARA